MTSEGNYSKRLLTYAEAAEYLGMSWRTLAEYKCQGKIGWVQIGQRVYFARPILDEYIEQNTHGAAVQV